jgi:RNA polymerase sigma-70 factor (ECF subfamily)
MSIVTVSGLNSQPLAEELEQLFRDYHELVYRTAYSVTGSAEDAEDVLQTVFLRLMRREHPPDLKRNPKGYLYRAAFNLSLNTVQSRRKHVLTDEAEKVEGSAIVSNSEDAEELDRRLYAAIAELHPNAAQILILRYVHNYSDADIANMLGTSRGTIAVSLFRSRARLKKLIRASLGEK